VLSAADAHQIGLINRVIPRAKFDHEWRSLA
jgi:enoyl-CoA hydratase/carnithine racemase